MQSGLLLERTFGWLMRYRRLARDYERTIAHHEAMVYWATVFIMTKRLTRYETGQPQPARWGGERARPAQQAALSTGSKTDKLDCIWLCKVAERQMIRPSFVPPPPFRKLRDLTRYRADLVAARTAEKNRVEKLLEDAQIKLSVVVSDIFGVSGRDMLAALVAGERNPQVLAQLARRSMRKKITVLEEAFTGYFTDHHAFLLARMLARVDAITADIAAMDARIEQQIAPFAAAVAKLDEVPGINLAAAPPFP